MRKKYLLAIFGLLFLLSAILLVLKLDFSNLPFNQKKLSITLADPQQPVFALVYIAEKKGYFKEEGLDVNYRKFTLGRDALEDAINGKSDIAMTYETPFVYRLFQGKDIGIISTLHTSNKNTALVVKTDRGIEDIEDLEGKTIALPKSTNQEFFLYFLLLGNGVDTSGINLVDIKVSDYKKVFESESVDGVIAWNENLHNLRKSHESKIKTYYSDVFVEITVLAGKKTVIREKEKEIKRFLSALVKAEKFAASNREDSIDLVKESLPKSSGDYIQTAWDSYKLKVGLNNVLLTILNSEAKWLQEAGVYDTLLPNFRKVFMPEYLSEIKPDSVTYF